MRYVVAALSIVFVALLVLVGLMAIELFDINFRVPITFGDATRAVAEDEADTAEDTVEADTPAGEEFVPSATGANECPTTEAIRTDVQGLIQPDGTLIAQIGADGCRTVFEGRLFYEGQTEPGNWHDIVMVVGPRDGFRFWEGSFWQIPNSWDASTFADLLANGKIDNWLAQGIDPLEIRFGGFTPSKLSIPPGQRPADQ